MRFNRPQSPHSNTICPPLPKNAGTYLSKPFEHPNTNQNFRFRSVNSPLVPRKSSLLFSQTRGEWWKTRLVFLATSPLSLALLREACAAWPLIESAAERETSSLRMKDEKKRCDSEETEAAAILQRALLLAAAVSFFFSASSATEVANAATQKRPWRENLPIKGVFSRHGRK